MSDKLMELLEKLGVGLLGAGVMFIIFTIMNIGDNAKTPENYNTLAMSDYYDGIMVEGDIQENFGCYAEPGAPAGGSGWYYLIKCGDNGYIWGSTPMTKRCAAGWISSLQHTRQFTLKAR